MALQISAPAKVKNILYLTDFSEPSESALPFVTAVARAYGAKVYALHVLIPNAYTYMTPDLAAAAIEAEEEGARDDARKLESQLAGLPSEMIVERGMEVWPAAEQAIRDCQIDLVVLGTHGRTGIQKMLLGSVAEEIFRRSPVPVLTIGPGARAGLHGGGRFHQILFATDFSPTAHAAAGYALSLAQENEARLLLVHAIPRRDAGKKNADLSVAEAIHQLYEIVPRDVELRNPPEVAVEYGEAAARILDAAKKRGADLIVLAVRAPDAAGAATHLGGATAHKVVTQAPCPVLTVRG